jgi:hypothetical protein
LRNGYGQLPITIFTAGSSVPLLVTSLNQEVHLLEGAYDVYFPTHPPILISDVSIQEGSLYPVSIPQPGVLQLNGFLMGFAMVLNADHEVVYQWKSGKSTPVGQHLLQPGDYTFVYRARSAQSIEFSFVKSFNIRSGNTTHLSING